MDVMQAQQPQSLLANKITGEKPELWPIFICYRRVDGHATARRIHQVLDRVATSLPNGESILLDVYLDQDMPGVANWRDLHRPYLEKARAIIVVCTPGLKLNEGKSDWVHKEISWWLDKRVVAPILIDPLAFGTRYVPDAIQKRWPDIQRLTVLENEWSMLSGGDLELKTAALRRQILGAILPSGAQIYSQELKDERRRAQQLRRAFAAAMILAAGFAGAGIYAWDQTRKVEANAQIALTNARAANASRLDASAARSFAESRLLDSRWGAARARRVDLQQCLNGSCDRLTPVRRSNLEDEISQLERVLKRLAADAASKRAEGYVTMQAADHAWSELPAAERNNRVLDTRPPLVFTVELINGGAGESILVHFGTPDQTSLILINGGDTASYRAFVEPRLREISRNRFGGEPTPIQLFIVGDQDAEKTEGLREMLRDLSSSDSGASSYVALRGVWANIFEAQQRGLRPEIRQRIDHLRIPLNEPFDHVVMRPEKGRLAVEIRDRLGLLVLGPRSDHLAELHKWSTRPRNEGGAATPFPVEQFSNIPIVEIVDPLQPLIVRASPNDACRPSAHALAESKHLRGNIDQSIPNLASTVLLLQFGGKSFLFTGDSRSDLVLDGLQAAGLLDANGRAHVDLASIPHLGSDRNVTPEFFERVTADGYLFSGDGQHDNPEISTVAALIAARGCDSYDMYFANRDGRQASNGAPAHGDKLDEFFALERQHAPNYRRVFRSTARGSLIIDLLDPVRY